jgi:hypothetical protein
MGSRKAPSSRANSWPVVSGSFSPARRANARICAGRDGFRQYSDVSPIGASPGTGVRRLLKGSPGGFRESCTIELEPTRQEMQIEEVLDAMGIWEALSGDQGKNGSSRKRPTNHS